MKFAGLPLRLKLGIAFGALALMVLAVSSISLSALAGADANFSRFVGGISARTALAAQFRSAVDLRAISARNLVLVTRPEDTALEKELVLQAHADVQDRLARLKELVRTSGASGRAVELVGDIDRIEQEYAPVALAIVDDALHGRREQAIAAMNDKCRPLLARLVKATDAYARFSAGVAQDLSTASNEEVARERNLLLGASLCAVLLALAAGYVVTRSITVPVGRALALAEAVANGDLTRQVDANGKDEVSQLLAALGRMTRSLSGIVHRVRGSSDSIATGAAEIATGNSDLSQRTEQQASALQQTAATMEQLTTTIRTNADHARQANQLARGATDIAVRGGTIVAEAVGTMRGINESSRKIADIIGVIDGIAFQTNILALNAAVEAARAGEQGRGFAVVASEVRSLASRSAEAAKQIKSLIEASVGQVEKGTREVDTRIGVLTA